MNNKKYALAFDLGTGSVKASLWDEDCCCLCQTVISYPTDCGADGIRREQRPEDWWKAVNAARYQLLQGRDDLDKIGVIGISGHSIGVVPMDSEGRLLTEKTPIWSDQRATRQARRFEAENDSETWYRDTGCGFPMQLYGIFKIAWLREECPELYHKTHVFLGTKDYLNYRLTGCMATDESYAAGSGALSLTARQYDSTYTNALDIDKSKLPVLRKPDEVIGTLLPQIADEWGLSGDVGVVCGSVDNLCMCLGAGCIHPGEAYISLGSSAWVAACTDQLVSNRSVGVYTFPHLFTGGTA